MMDRNALAQKIEFLASGLAALARRLEPAEAAKLCGSAARSLITTIERNPGHGPMKALATLLKLTEPDEARKLCARVAQMWAADLENENSLRNASNLASIADWLEPVRAAELFGRASRFLAASIENEQDWQAQDKLTSELATVASGMKPSDGAQIVFSIMRNNPGGSVTGEWISRLVSLTRRIPPAEAEAVCSEAIRFYLKRDEPVCPPIAFLLSQINRPKAREFAFEFARSMYSEKDIDYYGWSSRAGGGEIELGLPSAMPTDYRPSLGRPTQGISMGKAQRHQTLSPRAASQHRNWSNCSRCRRVSAEPVASCWTIWVTSTAGDLPITGSSSALPGRRVCNLTSPLPHAGPIRRNPSNAC